MRDPTKFYALDDVKFRDWDFRVTSSAGRDYLQVVFYAPDITMPVQESVSHVEFQPQSSRKWLLSPSMTDGEIVQTAFKAVMCAMEHEIREEFTYKEAAIFGPHFDIETLVEICQRGATVHRSDRIYGDVEATIP
jgi:hypothetical protein